MSDDPRDGARRAIERWSQKQLEPQQTKPRRSNKKPEAELVKQLQALCKTLGIAIHKVEASSYDFVAKRTTASRVEAGYSDLSGNTDHGIAVYVEAKAPGRLSTLKDHQRRFLVSKIHQNCFSCCVDSVDRLEFIYKKWCQLRRMNIDKESKDFLLSQLPQEPKRREAKNDSELPF